MKDGFYIMIETYHLADKGDTPNAHELPKDKLEKREVVPIDIANDPVAPNDYKVRKQKPGKKLHVFPHHTSAVSIKAHRVAIWFLLPWVQKFASVSLAQI